VQNPDTNVTMLGTAALADVGLSLADKG